MDTEHVDECIQQISGLRHWFLEGWIGDHSVEFLVDLGSSVTAISNSLYQTLVRAGAPVGTLRSTSRTLWGANGTPIWISGCSHCMVWFMGLQTECPILICDLNTDAIIGTPISWDRCYLILWILRMVYCSRNVVSHFNCIGLTLLCRDVFSLLAIVQYPILGSSTCTSLHHTHSGWPAHVLQRIIRRTFVICRTYWPCGEQNSCGSFFMECSSSGVQLQAGNCYGRTFFASWHGGTDISHIV